MFFLKSILSMQFKTGRTIPAKESETQSQTNQDNVQFSVKGEHVTSSVDEEIARQKKDKFYLPVLRINSPDEWPSQPKEKRIKFTDEVGTKTCLGNCCGIDGLKAGCCKIDPDDLEHVLGPVDEEWIKETLKWFKTKNMPLKREDLVIDFEEGVLIGERLFNSHPVFKSPTTYPILRMQVNGPRYSCKFLSPETGFCTIYPIRPKMCREYYCEYVKANFLVKTTQHRYEKMR